MKKKLIIIFILTLLFGTLAYVLASQVNKTIAEVTSTRNQRDELTRIAIDKKTYSEEKQALNKYTSTTKTSLPGISEIPKTIEQLESIAQITNLNLSIKLEEGIVGQQEIEFQDEQERNKFLEKLDPQKSDSTPQETGNSSESAENINIAVKIIEDAENEDEQALKISYIEIYLSLEGEYRQIRSFISLLQSSRYLFNIKEIRLNKTEDGKLESTLKVRAFIFEK